MTQMAQQEQGGLYRNVKCPNIFLCFTCAEMYVCVMKTHVHIVLHEANHYKKQYSIYLTTGHQLFVSLRHKTCMLNWFLAFFSLEIIYKNQFFN